MHAPLKCLGFSAALFLHCSSVFTQANVSPLLEHSFDRSIDQSLRMVYFKNTPEPPPLTATDILRVQTLKTEDPKAFAVLGEVYKGNIRYIALATRDLDGDGILDYSVALGSSDNRFAGKFRENDLDVDGDQIDNIYDHAPYDPNRGGVDTNANRIPDRDGVDYMHAGLLFSISPKFAKVQHLFFERYQIALIEKDLAFTAVQIQLLCDLFQRVLGEALRLPSKKQSYFRALTAERYVFADPELNDGTYAAVLPQSQTLILFGNASKLAPVLQLGLMAHELAHGLHCREDLKSRDLRGSLARRPMDTPFLQRMEEQYSWQVRPKPGAAQTSVPYHSTWSYGEGDSPQWLYQGIATGKWFKKIEDIPACEDHQHAPRNQAQIMELQKAGVVGRYAMSDPYEFYADGFMSYFLAQVEDSVVRESESSVDSPGDGSSKIKWSFRHFINSEWPCFFYWNISGSKLEKEFDRKFLLHSDDVRYFAKKYLAIKH